MAKQETTAVTKKVMRVTLTTRGARLTNAEAEERVAAHLRHVHLSDGVDVTDVTAEVMDSDVKNVPVE